MTVWWRAASMSNGSTRSPNNSSKPSSGARQSVPAPDCWQHGDLEQHLRQDHAGEIERFGDLLVLPSLHGWIWRWPHRLGDHVGVEHDRPNFIGFAGDLSRVWSMAAMSSSMSPTLRPRAASAFPRRTRLTGFTARSRMSRVSASELRPCWAASTRRARCTSAGTFLTVIEAMMAKPGVLGLIAASQNASMFTTAMPALSIRSSSVFRCSRISANHCCGAATVTARMTPAISNARHIPAPYAVPAGTADAPSALPSRLAHAFEYVLLVLRLHVRRPVASHNVDHPRCNRHPIA
jgi:hypothetical protein